VVAARGIPLKGSTRADAVGQGKSGGARVTGCRQWPADGEHCGVLALLCLAAEGDHRIQGHEREAVVLGAEHGLVGGGEDEQGPQRDPPRGSVRDSDGEEVQQRDRPSPSHWTTFNTLL
jgi:hypothetical protein